MKLNENGKSYSKRRAAERAASQKCSVLFFFYLSANINANLTFDIKRKICLKKWVFSLLKWSAIALSHFRFYLRKKNCSEFRRTPLQCLPLQCLPLQCLPLQWFHDFAKDLHFHRENRFSQLSPVPLLAAPYGHCKNC